MANISISDSYFSNISNIKQKAQKPSNDTNSFYDTMQMETNNKEFDNNDKQTVKKDEKPHTEKYNPKTEVEKKHTENKDTDKPVVENDKVTNDKTVIEEDQQLDKVQSDLSEVSDDILAEMEHILGITSEEILKVMESLGIQSLDLLNPEKLTQLMVTLSGESDILSLITNEQIYDNVTQIIKTLENNLGEMESKYSLNGQQLQEIIKTVEKEMNQSLEIEVGESESSDEIVVSEEATLGKETLGKETLNKENPIKTGATKETVSKENNVEVNLPKEDIPVENLKQSKNVSESDEVDVGTIQKTPKTANEESRKIDVEVDIDTTKISTPKQGDLQNQQNPNDNKEQTSHTGNEEQQMLFGPNTNLQSIGEQIQSKLDAILQEANGSDKYPNTEHIMKQVVSQMKLRMSGDVSEMEMQLHPASLGTIHLQVAFKAGALTAQLTTQSEAVKIALESQMVQLKENLNEQGLKVEAIEVTVSTHEFERNLDQGNQQHNDANQSNKQGRRKISLSGIDNLDDMEEELSEADQITAEIMMKNGNSVDFSA